MAFGKLSITTGPDRMELNVLDDKESAILLVIYKHAPQSITEMMRALRLGGDTFYHHKKALVETGLIREVPGRDSRIRVVRLELTNQGVEAASLLDKLSAVLNETTV